MVDNLIKNKKERVNMANANEKAWAAFFGEILGVILAVALGVFLVTVFLRQKEENDSSPKKPVVVTSVVTSVTNTVVVVREVEKNVEEKKEEVVQKSIKGVETNGIIEFRKIKTKLKFD